jgi:hypothetical protein
MDSEQAARGRELANQAVRPVSNGKDKEGGPWVQRSPAYSALQGRAPMRRLAYFVGPNGNAVTIADLPSPTATRWVIRRKAEVVFAVHAGLLSLGEACTRYRLTVEEFSSWQSAIEKHGLLGLRATRVQQYRPWRQEPADGNLKPRACPEQPRLRFRSVEREKE